MKFFFICMFVCMSVCLAAGSALGYDTLIDSQTAAVTTSSFNRVYDGDITIVANGLSAGEEIGLEVEYADDSYVDVYNSDDEKVVLTSTKNILFISGFGRYRLVKPVTSSAVTVVKYTNKSP